jgi:hypothetical protein
LATHAIRPIAPLYRVGYERFNTVPLSATQTFSEGAVIVQNATDGTYEEAGADPSAIAGIALAAADDYDWSADTFGFTVARIPIASPDQVFRGNLADAASAGAVAIANISAEIGVSYGLVKDATTGFWVVDHADITNTRVRIVGIDDDVADGDENIVVHFVILDANQEAIS